MRTETKVAANKARVQLICLIVSVIVAVTTFIILQLAVGKEKLGFAPIWMLFIVFFMLLGASFLVLSALHRRTLIMVSGGASFIIGLAILMFCLNKYIPWFITIIVILALIVILFVLTFVVKAPALAVEFDNGPGSGRESYETRRAEAEARRVAEREAEASKPLPVIQSFKPEKDDDDTSGGASA